MSSLKTVIFKDEAYKKEYSSLKMAIFEDEAFWTSSFKPVEEIVDT